MNHPDRQNCDHFTCFISSAHLFNPHTLCSNDRWWFQVTQVGHSVNQIRTKLWNVGTIKRRNKCATEPIDSTRTITAKASGPPQVICFGEILHDLLSRTPDADETNATDWDVFMGGCPSNVAGSLAALGTAVAFVGNVGDDSTGNACIQEMQSRNVDMSGVNVVPCRSTRRIYVRRSRTGERAFVGYDGDNQSFADTLHVEVDKIADGLFSSARVFVTGTMGLAVPGSGSSVKSAIKKAKTNNMLVVIDVNWRDRIWAHVSDSDARARIGNILTLADVIKASVEDIAFLLGDDFEPRALQDPQAVREALGAGRCGLIVTAGEKGASYVFHERGSSAAVVAGKVDAFIPPTGVVDTTGAGDAFVAAFLSELLKEAGTSRPSECFTDASVMQRVMDFAAKVAGVVVGGTGAIEPFVGREQISAISKNPASSPSDIIRQLDIPRDVP